MKTLKNKTTATLIALFMILIMAASTMITCSKAQVLTQTFSTYGYINAQPNPCGVGQTAVVGFWLSNAPPNALVTGGARWQDMTVKVTKPDGTVASLGSFTSDDTGGTSTTYTPTVVGNYTFNLSFPGQTITGFVSGLFGGPQTPINYTYLASTASFTLVVQQTPAPSVVVPPLPTSYWTRPINAQNEGWSSISSNWYMPAWDFMGRQFDQGVAYDPYGTTPASSHVLWTSLLTFGGLAGGEFGTTSFYNGMSYEQFFKPPVIISGRLYYQTIGTQEPISSITCLDLTTGKQLFTIPNAALSFGQIYNYISPNQGGTFAYLWDTSTTPGTWRMFDAWTGQYILSVANVPLGSIALSPAIFLDNTFTPTAGPGDILVYNLDPTTQTMTMWNSTLMFEQYMTGPPVNNVWEWRPYAFAGQTLNGTLGIQWNVTLTNMPVGGSIAQAGYENTVYVYNKTSTQTLGGATSISFAFPLISSWCGYSMTDGHLLWGPTTIDMTSKLAKDSIPFNMNAFAGGDHTIGDGGVLAVFDRETEQLYAWNVRTGQFLWGPTSALTSPLGVYNWQTEWDINGIVYNSGYDGMIHAYNATTGTHLWDFSSGNAGTTTPYGTWPFYNGLTIIGTGVDSTVTGTTGQHGNGVQPLYQGEGLYVLNAVTGTQLWNITGWFCQPVIGDGMMLSQNLYDNQIYAFGMGPSKTTVTAPDVGVTTATPVTITGSVTDVSAGASQNAVSANFPNGLPCVSDASMTQFMEAVYEQQPIPSNIAGVPVTLYVLDSNNNYRSIGTTTTNAQGEYGLTWKPDITGNYTITAVFGGTHSYYGSSASTYFYAGSPSATPAPTATPLTGLASNATVEYGIVAIAIIIIVIGAVLAMLVTRKRP
jgi:outer membrane protein assembly factor BamB